MRDSAYLYSDVRRIKSVGLADVEFYRTAMVQDYSLSVSGATDNVNYMFSGGYMNQEGLATGTGYERFSRSAQMLNLKSINTFRLELIWLLLIL